MAGGPRPKLIEPYVYCGVMMIFAMAAYMLRRQANRIRTTEGTCWSSYMKHGCRQLCLLIWGFARRAIVTHRRHTFLRVCGSLQITMSNNSRLPNLRKWLASVRAEVVRDAMTMWGVSTSGVMQVRLRFLGAFPIEYWFRVSR